MADLIAGKYEILGKVGQGGMGTVYKVRHTTLETVYALKVLPDISAGNAELVGRFRREARIMAQLRHDNIVRVFDITHERDVHCLVMEFIDGPTLAQHMRACGVLPGSDALEIARQVGRALAYAHGRGVVHRDVKPSNVLIESTAPLHALLSDFGIAKVEDQGERTRTGSLLGSLRYSAPEQLSGEELAPIDARADIFALGLVVYEMFEGKQFHANRGEGEIYRRMLYDPAPLVPEFSHPVPPAVQALVARAIQRDPAERYASATEMLQALDRCIEALREDDDEGKTRVIPRPQRKDAPDEPTDDEVSDDELDQRIRALEIERQRRLVQSSRARADAARERARAARGPELAATAFDEASARESEATVALDDSQYLKARDLLEDAARLFGEAEAAAAAARLVQETDAAQAAMQAARAAADEAHAPDEARTLYERALALEGEADGYRGRKGHVEAQRGYAEAGRLYGEARSEARKRRRQLVERAHGVAVRARAIAEEAGAAEHAPALFRRATMRADEAAAAAKRDDYETARALLEEAGRSFGEAASEAVARRAAAERQAMLAAKDAAARLNAAGSAADPWARAAASETQAERHLAGGAAAEAERAFAEARRLYGESEASARRIQRETADRALAGVEAARTRAESLSADRVAPELYRRATAGADRARAAIEQADYAKGQRLLEEAARSFAEASAKAEDARREQAALRAREEMQATKQRAQQYVATVDGPAGSARAARLEADAEGHLARGAFVEAERDFEKARQSYDEEGRRAREAQRAAAERARADVDPARQAALAAGAADHAPTTLRDARAQEKRAEALLDKGEFVAAAELFVSLSRSYERAAGEAREAVERQAEVERRRLAEEAEETTTRVVAPVTPDFDETVLVPRRSDPEPPVHDATVVLVPPSDDATRVAVARDLDSTVLASRRAVAPMPPVDDGTVAANRDATVYQPPAARGTGVAHDARAALNPVAVTSASRPARPAPSSSMRLYAALGAAALVGIVAVYLVTTRPGTGERVPQSPPAPERAARPSPPPAWRRTIPAGDQAALMPGKTLRFAAEIDDAPGGANASYAWSIDGQERAQGSSWEYTPSPQDAGATREVKVIASLGTERLERAWRVHVGQPNRPPTIASVSPQAGSVTLDAGAEQRFTVTAGDADGDDVLTYVWERNGRATAEGPESSWTLHDAEDGDQVRVTVRDRAGLAADAQTWRVAIAKPPPVVSPAKAPLRIVGQTPTDKTVSIGEGSTVDFSVRTDPSNTRLAYVWFLDGQEVGRRSTWQFKAPSSDGSKIAHRVEAQVADDAGLAAPRAIWEVEVSAVPPRIVEYSPRERRVVAEPGKPIRFTASARAADGASALTYEWVLDGEAPRRTSEGRFEAPALPPGEHVVQLTSLDRRGLRSSPQRWTVETRKPAIDAARVEPPAVAIPPPPSVEQLTDNDVRDWLRRYKAAWESREVDALQRLGIVTAAQAAAIEKALAQYKAFHVALTNEQITLRGKQATVSFDRADTDETGKTMTHPKQTWQLEKRASGVVAVGKGP